MEYDELLTVVGDFGLYQLVIFLITSTLAFQTTCNNLGIVFLGASPDHFCKVPELESLNLTWDELKNATIPLEGESYSKCRMYQRNYTDWTVHDVTEALTSNKSSLETVDCTNGWNYDPSVYTSTIVTQVSSLHL